MLIASFPNKGKNNKQYVVLTVRSLNPYHDRSPSLVGQGHTDYLMQLIMHSIAERGYCRNTYKATCGDYCE